MSSAEHGHLTRQGLLDYFSGAATPRAEWQIGMEVERLGRMSDGGAPIPYSGGTASVLAVLEYLRGSRGGNPVYEGDHLIGLDTPWGSISLEPGGQVEWSSRPEADLAALRVALDEHSQAMQEAGARLGIDWLDAAVDPDLPVSAMPWMPKARYNIMRPYLGERGRLAHRMMTQTASIQCAFDYSDLDDWKRKFKAGALLAPVATALFANSSRIDGAQSGYRSYRQAIWRETDPDRCGLPPVVFAKDFDMARWLEWVMSVPMIFRHRARGRVPAGGVPFDRLMEQHGCDAVHENDWETHLSTIFTDVRSYTYIEIRSADLLAGSLAFAVPSFWTGLLYCEDKLSGALELGASIDDYESWDAAMLSAARDGLDGEMGGRPLRELVTDAVKLSLRGLSGEAACSGRGESDGQLRELAARHELNI